MSAATHLDMYSPWTVLVRSLTESRTAGTCVQTMSTGRQKMRDANAVLWARNSAAVVAHIRKAGARGISTTQIAERTGMTRGGTFNHVKKLESDGVIQGNEINENGRRRATKWRMKQTTTEATR